ncbi:hypothetical protein Poli38472_007125 [Pythium oligandrum]|uniref:Uncharacterized protein n=1 Tax=Pythium oligandrum TaxID=41045 RepID=A0A8K1FD23_PYTOL|nr:hypothetical protein Poli38472_007125 [Pythium oligandrum]|eukprot:TMW58980.1 hypothetical protein Poli38472_007125 [Pythium oligandrum]
MPPKFRPIPPDYDTEGSAIGCIYSGNCKTIGANHPGVPSAVYKKRGFNSWYQGLRYSANPFCASDSSKKQDYDTVAASIKKGIPKNTCDITTCPASKDGYADIGLIDGVGPGHWGINSNGTCFPVINAYTGAYLCDPDNQFEMCASPRPDNVPKTSVMPEFNYQMDAISSNWPVHVGAYLDYLVYQVEWVTGKNGYVRWMLDGHPIFEITSDAFSNVGQDADKTNPQKIMLEEPMYLIMNVALSTTWGARPPNPGKVCRGDGSDPATNAISDEFPMYLKVDYIRLYQDLGSDLEADNYMQVGCDPASHPTREWILGHIDSYEDWDNLMVDVAGGAYCRTDDDCTIGATNNTQAVRLVTGKCENKRCKCMHGNSWGGPRCTAAIKETQSSTSKSSKVSGFGPPMEVAVSMAGLVIILTTILIWYAAREAAKPDRTLLLAQAGPVAHKASIGASPLDLPFKCDYSRDFV